MDLDVEDEVQGITNWILKTYMVKINKLEELLSSCSCKGYEFEGLLCSHAIKVMHHVGKFHLPNRYIMKRWCKDANARVKRSSIERSMEVGSTQEQEAIRFATLKPQVMSLLKTVAIAKRQLQEFSGEQETITCEIGTSARTPSQVILDPPISKYKGKRKQPQRYKPPSEAKKPRKCGICGSNKGGHNSRTCPMKKMQKKSRNSQEDDDVESGQEEEEVMASDGSYEYLST